MRYSRLVISLIVLICTATASAQPLADKIPSDALLYIGWTGGSSLPSGYANSHLKAVIDASDFDYLINKTIPSAIKRLAQEDPASANKIQLVGDLLTPILKYPSALYVGPPDPANPNDPIPTAAILCQAGPDAAQLLQQVQSLLKQSAPPIPINVTNHNGLLIVNIGQPPKLVLSTDQMDASLAANPQFTAMLAKAGPDPAIILYADVTAQLKLADQFLNQAVNKRANAQWQKMRAALALDNIQQVIATSGFEDKNWVSTAFIKTTNSNAGLLSLLPNQSISDELLKLVPQSASLVHATTINLSTIQQVIESIALASGEFTPNDISNINRDLNKLLGLNVKDDLLPALSGEYAYYWDRTIGSPSLASGVLVARVNDPAKAQQVLLNAEAALQKAANEKTSARFQIRMRTTQVGTTTIHYLAIPAIAPSWALDGQTFYFGFYPQVVASAIAAKSQPQSILDNPHFAAWRKSLPQARTTNLSYIDLPEITPNRYATSLLVSRISLGLGDIFGIDAPAMLPAPLHALLAELDISTASLWKDTDGIHFKATTPFPLADMLTLTGPDTIGMVALGTSIMLPSFGHSRETAHRVKCASNLRQIGQGMYLYANENKGKLPPDFASIVRTQDIGVEVFLCPSTNSERPANWAQMTPAEQDDWVNQNSDYVYLGNGRLNNISPEAPLAYEKPFNHDGDGINVLFGDGHVEFLSRQAAGSLLKQFTGTNPYAD